MLFRRKETSPTPTNLGPDVKINNTPKILETIRQLGIDPKYFIVMGSAALTLRGLPRAASDVDLILHPDEHTAVLKRGAVPSGLPIIAPEPGTAEERIGRIFIPSQVGLSLPVDIIRDRGGLPELRDTFSEFYNSGETTDSGIRVVSLEDLINTKTGYNPMRDPLKRANDVYDLELLQVYNRSHKR